MRRFTNSEAAVVADLVANTSQVRELESALRKLKKEQKQKREAVKCVVDQHGEAHNSEHTVTITPERRAGYFVHSFSFDKFNIVER